MKFKSENILWNYNIYIFNFCKFNYMFLINIGREKVILNCG